MIDLPPDQLDQVRAIVRRHVPEFGQRAVGRAIVGEDVLELVLGQPGKDLGNLPGQFAHVTHFVVTRRDDADQFSAVMRRDS